MKTDYQKMMEQQIDELGGVRPRLLMQACCAPCSSSVLERVEPFFEVTLFYYNPNIQPRDEYEKRGGEFYKLLKENGMEDRVKLIIPEYDDTPFMTAAAGLESEPEGGARCAKCFETRLGKTAEMAAAGNYDFFGTTLTVSPHKDPVIINGIGRELEKACGVKWLFSDFKKKDGYLRSIRLSQEYGLYRQCYCGCAFSMQ